MTAHELMIKTYHYLIKGGNLTEEQKQNIVRQLLSAKNNNTSINSFKEGVKAPEYMVSIGQSTDERIMYPLFYITPYNNGIKSQTVLPLYPKTHILSANSYEMEILRLLWLFSPNDSVVQNMVAKTFERLKTTCFGYHDCHHGECFHSSLITLRFISTVTDDKQWIEKLITYYHNYSGGKYHHANTVWYYWLCLSEMPFELAKADILSYKNEFIQKLNKSYLMNNEVDKIHNPVLLYILRNCLSRLPEYEYLKSRQPYINQVDGRLCFDF